MRMGNGQGEAAGAGGFSSNLSSSSAQAPAGHLRSLQFCCHWEKNQPHSTDPSASRETSVEDKRSLNKYIPIQEAEEGERLGVFSPLSLSFLPSLFFTPWLSSSFFLSFFFILTLLTTYPTDQQNKIKATPPSQCHPVLNAEDLEKVLLTQSQ